jgi:hypothetical protein
MLIHKELLKIKGVCSKNKYGAEYKKGIFLDVKNKRLFTTDGTVLIETDLTEEIKKASIEDFPNITGTKKGEEPADNEVIFLTKDSIDSVDKRLPIKCNSLPILQFANITKKDGKTLIETTDLETSAVTRVSQELEAPNIDIIKPKDKAVFEIEFCNDTLQQLLSVIPDDKVIKFTFYAKEKAVKIDTTDSRGNKMTGLIMPANPNR